MTREAQIYQDGLMRTAMREMPDNMIQALIDRDPLCCDPLQGWVMCRACRWGSMAHRERSTRNYIRNAPKGASA